MNINLPATTYDPNRTQQDPINPPNPNKNPIRSQILAPKIEEKNSTLTNI